MRMSCFVSTFGTTYGGRERVENHHHHHQRPVHIHIYIILLRYKSYPKLYIYILHVHGSEYILGDNHHRWYMVTDGRYRIGQ
jgi:hypothetical protein